MTMAGAVRDLLTRQGRYWRWQEDRKRYGPAEDSLRRLGRSILEEYPEMTKAQLAWNMAKRSGRFVDIKAVNRIASELRP